MAIRVPVWGPLVLSLLGLGCLGPRGFSVQTTDSATSVCLRTPACVTRAPGEEALLPWLSRTAEAARTATVVMRLLDAAQLGRVQDLVFQCVKQASVAIDQSDDVLRGRSPDREECQRVVRRENGRDVTRAMDLGNKKHAAAMDCIRQELGKHFPEHISLEPRYQKDPDTGRWMRLDPEQVKEWVLLGMMGRLVGSLAPDVVVHEAGNPNKVQGVYDLKFPCPERNEPRWGRYASDHPHFPKSQGDMYQEALLTGQATPRRISPMGIF
ncbi:hypothetical protein [Melittangium boletus]|uniref:hypothetical protein n=1 Tax=Melittangium boletus TaxID=83453 RepID=UPI003DA36B65